MTQQIGDKVSYGGLGYVVTAVKAGTYCDLCDITDGVVSIPNVEASLLTPYTDKTPLSASAREALRVLSMLLA